MQVFENQALAFLVPGAGIEPARIAPLVFETSASTDSAIRAFCIGEGTENLSAGVLAGCWPHPEGTVEMFRSGIPLGC